MDRYCRVPYAFLDAALLLACTLTFSYGTRGIFISQTIVSKGRATNVSSNVVVYGGADAKTPREPSKGTNGPSPNPLPSPRLHVGTRRSRPPEHSVVFKSSRRSRTITWIPVKMYSRAKTTGRVFLPIVSIPGLASVLSSRPPMLYDLSARQTAVPNGTGSTGTFGGNMTRAKLWSRLLKHLRRTAVPVTTTCRKSTAEVASRLTELGLGQEDRQIDYSWDRQRNYQYYDYSPRVDPRRYGRYKRDAEENTTGQVEEISAETNNGTRRGRARRQAVDGDTRAIFLFFTVLMLLSLAAMVMYSPSESPAGSRRFIRLKPRRGDYARVPTFEPTEEVRFSCPHCTPFQRSLTFKSVARAKLLTRRLVRRRREQKLQGLKGRGSRRKRQRRKPPSSGSSSSSDVQKLGQKNTFQTVVSASNVETSPSVTAKTTGTLRVVLDKWEGDSKTTSNAAKFVVNDIPEHTKRVVLQVQLRRKLPCGDTRIYCREVTFNFEE